VEESGRLEAQLQVFNIVFEPSSTVLVLLVLAVVTVLGSSTDTLSCGCTCTVVVVPGYQQYLQQL
jgi:hypothetical protein